MTPDERKARLSWKDEVGDQAASRVDWIRAGRPRTRSGNAIADSFFEALMALVPEVKHD